MESTEKVDKAEAAADRLLTLMPAAGLAVPKSEIDKRQAQYEKKKAAKKRKAA